MPEKDGNAMHEKRFEGDIDRLRFPERLARLEVERVVGLCLEPGPVENMLDVGTGTGVFAEAFAQRGLPVSGVDVNPEMLSASRRFVPAGDFRLGTAEALPFPDGSFDLVFLGFVLHESDDPLTSLQESLRVARKRVCIQEWPYRAQPFGPPITDRLNPVGLADLFKKAGFQKWTTTDLVHTAFYCLSIP